MAIFFVNYIIFMQLFIQSIVLEFAFLFGDRLCFGNVFFKDLLIG